MLCENCESPKIVVIKGRSYCIGCGNEAKKPDAPKKVAVQPKSPTKVAGKPAVVAAKVSVKASAKPALQTKKPTELGELSPNDVNSMAAHSFGMLFKHHLLFSGIISDLLLAAVIVTPIMIACAFAAKFSFMGQDTRSLVYASAWATGLFTSLMLRAFYSSCMVYGLSKQLDHRHQHIKWWRQAARRSLWQIYMLKLLQLCILGIAVLLGFGLIELVKFLPVPGLVLPATFALSLALMTLALTSISATALARPAIVADQVPFAMAVKYSFIALKRRSRGIMSGGLLSLGAFAVGAFLIGAVIYGLVWAESQGFWQLGHWTALLAVAGSLVLIAACIHFSMLFSLALWLQIHQRLSRP